MQLPLVDPAEMPLPPEEVRIQSLDVTPYPDGRRMKIEVKLTPFQMSPDIDIIARDTDGKELASTSVIGSDNSDMVLTMHFKAENIPLQIAIRATVNYADVGTVDARGVELTLPPESEREGE